MSQTQPNQRPPHPCSPREAKLSEESAPCPEPSLLPGLALPSLALPPHSTSLGSVRGSRGVFAAATLLQRNRGDTESRRSFRTAKERPERAEVQ